MEKALTIIAVSGWAIPSEWFQDLVEKSFPGANVKVIYPSHPGDIFEAEYLLKGSKADLYIGYSLGSLWLMTYQEMLPKNSIKAVLAPIMAFVRERNRGGKIPETKLKYLVRQLGRNPNDRSQILKFHADCEIHFSGTLLKMLPDHRILINGLEFLKTAPVPHKQLKSFLALVGENDPLLDGVQLKRCLPQLQMVREAGHAPGPLLKRLSETLKY